MKQRKKIKLWILLSVIIPIVSSCDPELIHELFVINNTNQELELWIYDQVKSDSYIIDSVYIDTIDRLLIYYKILPNSQHKIYHSFQRTAIEGLETCIYQYNPMWFDSTNIIVTKDINTEINWVKEIEDELRFNMGGTVNCYFTINGTDIKTN